MFKSKLGANQIHIPCSRAGELVNPGARQPWPHREQWPAPSVGSGCRAYGSHTDRRKPLCPALEISCFSNCNFSMTFGPEGTTQPLSKPLLTVDQATLMLFCSWTLSSCLDGRWCLRHCAWRPWGAGVVLSPRDGGAEPGDEANAAAHSALLQDGPQAAAGWGRLSGRGFHIESSLSPTTHLQWGVCPHEHDSSLRGVTREQHPSQHLDAWSEAKSCRDGLRHDCVHPEKDWTAVLSHIREHGLKA